MNDFEEPSIPPHWRRPLAAAWISFAVHAAALVLVQVAPPRAVDSSESVIEARLVPASQPLAESASERVEEAPKAAPEPEPAKPEVQPPPRREIPKPERLAPVEVPEAVPLPEAPPEPQPTTEPASEPAPMPSEPAPAAALVSAPAAAADDEDTTVVPLGAAAPAPAPAPAAITTAVDLTYYSVRELDVQPRALREIVPTYPRDADRRRLSGKVRLQLKIEADGRISDVEVVSATPPGLFDASAVDAFRSARFAPAQKGGRPVRARVVIEVLYDWEGRMRGR